MTAVRSLFSRAHAQPRGFAALAAAGLLPAQAMAQGLPSMEAPSRGEGEGLLTTLQKEQGLITASGHRLNETRYAIAMGYACPDSSHCDPQYFGFATQVYYAARQFRIYEARPDLFMTAAGREDFVPFAPGEECGGARIFVENLATSNLYNYTPYQPNEAALSGAGGPCASVGNANFYAYFNAWFGTPEKAAESARLD